MELDLEVLAAELSSQVSYGPRALELLRSLQRLEVSKPLLRATKLGLIVRSYKCHSDPLVAWTAEQLIARWKECLGFTPAEPRRKQPLPDSCAASAGNEVRTDDAAPGSEEPNNSVPSSSSSAPASRAKSQAMQSGSQSKVWEAEESKQRYRNKVEVFKVFALKDPFEYEGLVVQVRMAEQYYRPECPDFLDSIAREFGAVRSSQPAASQEEEQLLQRLSRLEERFRGSGVTEGEARNAMRLFERELSKANWTQDKFAQLKRQMAGVEECTVADEVVEGSIYFTSSRRQQWFAALCERVAAPLGLAHGSCSGGCSFVGPLAATVGAMLTAALVAHLARLDLERALQLPGKSRLSTPQFMHGFVDGALDQDRHLVWEQIFAIGDEEEAARYCEKKLTDGFFQQQQEDEEPSSRCTTSHESSPSSSNAQPHNGGVSGEHHEVEGDDDLSAMLRNLFSAGDTRGRRGGPSRNRPRSFGPSFDDVPEIDPIPPPAPPPGFAPFQGKGHRLDDSDANQSDSCSATAPTMASKDTSGWALTFVSNLQLARKSHQRSVTESHKVYHWHTVMSREPSGPKKDSDSYSKGHAAGSKRKSEIDGASGRAKGKHSKSLRLSLADQ
mmetsp:Transcript_7890/g.17403  ORF Transcript_7890/g.17403 Transcript_7890/m.17403 type:complete len:614 (-) Transcript_7890:20-1861(-)